MYPILAHLNLILVINSKRLSNFINLDIMSGCKPNHNLKLYGFLFNCTTVGQASDSMTALA